MRITNRISVLLSFAAILIQAGCSSEIQPSVGPATKTVVDGLGRTVKVSVPLNRAVSLAPSITEMVFAAGAGDRLVGVTSYCNYPAEAKEIQKVGDTLNPNVESIVALKPQLVIVSTDSQLEAFTETLEKQGTAVYVLDIDSIGEVAKGLIALGELFGTEPAADKAVSEFTSRIDKASGTVKVNDRAKIFLQISNDPLFTIGKDSFLTELIERAGGDSVTKDLAGGYPNLSKETAVASDPDVIILSDSEDNVEPNRAFRDSKAVRNGRVYRINADILSRPGPRLADALEEIAGALSDPSKNPDNGK